MATHDLTKEDEHWLGVALEQVLDLAKKGMKIADDAGDVDDLLDYGLLVNRYSALAEKFPAPEIGERDE